MGRAQVVYTYEGWAVKVGRRVVHRGVLPAPERGREPGHMSQAYRKVKARARAARDDWNAGGLRRERVEREG